MLRFLLIASLVLLLAACGRSPTTNFYELYVKHATDDLVDHKTNSIGIGVWAVELPALLDRPEIVTRTDRYKIELADFHQWASDLDSNITQLIANELSRRLQTDRVVISPWSNYNKNDYQVKIDIHRFDGELGSEIVLSGIWSLVNAEGNKELTRETFTFKTQTTDKNYRDMVAALSKLILRLSEKISNDIAGRTK